VKKLSLLSVLSFALISGCEEPPETPTTSAPAAPTAPAAPDADGTATTTPARDSAPAAGSTEPSTTDSTPVTPESETKSIALTEANTTIEFVGVHVGEKPDPRKGKFEKLTGTATIEGNLLKALVIELDTTTLKTEIPKLTNHLKGTDFFDVNQFPTARYESTAIGTAEGGKVNITGNLTLLGVTKEITTTATISTEGGGLKLHSELSIDRTEFGMTYGEGQVEKEVALTVMIGA
jgi:polyisoprenoid-binding protein YceI